MLVIKDKGGGRTEQENIFANFSKLSLPIMIRFDASQYLPNGQCPPYHDGDADTDINGAMITIQTRMMTTIMATIMTTMTTTMMTAMTGTMMNDDGGRVCWVCCAN